MGLGCRGLTTLAPCAKAKGASVQCRDAVGGIFNAASGTLTVKDSTVLNNVAPLGADLYNLGALTLDDSTVGVIGP
jgi:hypothetical protein